MDAQDQTQYSDESSIMPSIEGDTSINESSVDANPNEVNINPAIANAAKAVEPQDVGSLDELKKTVEDLRKGVNPILSENKEAKARIEELEAKLAGQETEDSEEASDEATQAQIDALNLATRDDVRADLDALKADMVLEKKIDDLGIGEKKQELIDLMSLESNKGLSPHEVAEKYSLADDFKINQAKMRTLKGNANIQGSKDLSKLEDVDINNPDELKIFIDSNSTNTNFC